MICYEEISSISDFVAGIFVGYIDDDSWNVVSSVEMMRTATGNPSPLADYIIASRHFFILCLNNEGLLDASIYDNNIMMIVMVVIL